MPRAANILPLPARRLIQALALVIATAYATVLIYQAVAPRQWIDDDQQQQQQIALQLEHSGDESLSLLELPVPRQYRPGGLMPLSLKKLRAIGGSGGVNELTPVTPSLATATMVPFSTDLDDLFISVKTTRHYHHLRLPTIIDTWFQFAKEQTWFFTDRDDPYYQNQTNGHMINTKCSSSHSRRALCCKMSVEFDRFLESGKKWFCHFDDDNYVNVPRLVKLLDNYNPREDWYLGRPSIPTPLEIVRQGADSTKRSEQELILLGKPLHDSQEYYAKTEDWSLCAHYEEQGGRP
ncbi:hypothetical protein QAD02_018649 [Eretmocerus hayati]|uniref:Uncharacterized protein n=1 Tax=Eretmocerus hayati TaxID=131215 RepID=A0ACC2PKC4_9HYME|nr:hypothetical protein QAD02_018649 [Eretmocerus hayati]